MRFIKLLLIGLMFTAFSCSQEKEQKSEADKVKEMVKAGMDDASNKKAPENTVLAKFEFSEKEFDFGDIQQGDKVEHIFKFKNVGDAPLLITNIKTTCGCTAPEWPKEAIAPGAESEIKVSFNSRGKKGKQEKMVTILANVQDGMDWMRIKANVLHEDVSASR